MRTHLHVGHLHRRDRHLLAQSMSPEPSTALADFQMLEREGCDRCSGMSGLAVLPCGQG